MGDIQDPAGAILRGRFFSVFGFPIHSPSPLEVGTLVAVDENLATREINHAHASIRTARSTSVPMRHSPR